MKSPDRKKPRIGLIGVTGYATIYVQLLREPIERGEVELAAAVIINPEEVPTLCEELKNRGTRIYSDYKEMLAEEAGGIDICLIPTGIQWHARMTIAALHAGMNVLVEKPLAGSLEDVRMIREAEVASGRWVAVGFQDIYAEEALQIKKLLCAQEIGRIRKVKMLGIWPRPRSYFNRNHWAGRLRADGAAVYDSPLNNAFAHFVNLCLYFAGPSASQSAQPKITSVELHRAHAIESFDTAVIIGKSSEGVNFWFGATHSSDQTREPEIHIEGTEGSCVWYHESRCVITRNGKETVIPLPDTTGTRHSMFDAVMAKLAKPASRICDTGIAEAHTALIEAVHHHGRVHEIPAELITWSNTQEPEKAIPVVQGLAEFLDAALHHTCSLAEAGFLSESPLSSQSV